ncbi:uncharacterized protein LOC103314894 [Tribolium castaneum]|uniref:uncharacterized protein LOC103314894 n=1 Tax=Tribolium castaneum TaxID=7070 RepID=UPI00046C33DA|nr:PREDICTED: uncharacterized protein LOC103314894 [Tribolium castaneum]|eukprot:XP_008200326.1 PREDICTED: uncharacterized protein LOC103314894 [Tribolium castaneum]
MARITQEQITLGKTASFLGIVQGLTWFIMSLLCIIEYSINTLPAPPETYIEKFNWRVYYFFLYKDAKLPHSVIIKPTAFLVFMCFYIILSTVWVIASCCQLSVLKNRGLNVPILFKDWAIITFLISFVDLIFVILLGCDYEQNCLYYFGQEICINTFIPVLVIAARGFVLWFVNVFVAWRTFKNAKILREGGPYANTFGGIIPIYNKSTDRRIPRVTVPASPSLYNQQFGVVSKERNFWNVNLRTAMDNRTPPVTPSTPYYNKQPFFAR